MDNPLAVGLKRVRLVRFSLGNDNNEMITTVINIRRVIKNSDLFNALIPMKTIALTIAKKMRLRRIGLPPKIADKAAPSPMV